MSTINDDDDDFAHL